VSNLESHTNQVIYNLKIFIYKVNYNKPPWCQLIYWSFLQVSINPSTYLNYLLNTFTSLGGTTQRANLSHLKECIESDTDIVVNCSGIHARTLGGVENFDVFPARGQTVIAQLPQSYMNWAFFKRGNVGCWTYSLCLFDFLEIKF